MEEAAELTSNWKNHTKLYSHQVYINHRPQEVEVGDGDGDGDGVVADVALSGVWEGGTNQKQPQEKREKLAAMTHPHHSTTTTTTANASSHC